MGKIFISHSSKDAEQAELVFAWLQQNNYEAFLDSDQELGIAAGSDWSEQLRISLNECRILIAICSQNYRESDWCRYEVDVAYHRCLTIIPILIDDSPLLGILKPTHCIKLKKSLQDAQTRLLNGIRHHLSSDLALGWDAQRRPFPGLDPFNENDERIFYGREAEIEETVRHLRTIRRERDHCLHLVIGASGSGKSSLVQAGVIPRLKRDAEAWIVLPSFHPGSEPLREWASSIVTALSRYNLPSQHEEFLQRFQTDPERTTADLVETFRTQTGEQEASLLVTIDQFEELLELRPETSAKSQRLQFAQKLKTILDCKELAGRLVVIGTLRSDFLDTFQEARYFQSIRSSKQILVPMGRKNFRQVIVKPAELAEIEIEDKLVDAMVEDTETGDALPLLAFTLRELWEKKTEQRQATGAKITINLGDYQQIGGLGGAIQQRAEQIYRDHCSPDQQKQLRDCLLHMVRSNADIDQVGWVKRAALWSQMPPESHAVLDRFVTARLLVKKKSNPSPHHKSTNPAHEELLIEPTHEALLRNWKRLEDWIKEQNDFLLWRDRFHIGFNDWQRSSSLNKDHLGGAKLLEAEKWKDKLSLNSPERLFIQAGIRRRRDKALARYALVSGLFAGLIYSLHLWQDAKEAQAYQYKIRQSTTLESDSFESGVAGLAAMGRFFVRPGLNYQIARGLEQAISVTLAATSRVATQFSGIDAITPISEQLLVVNGTQGQVAALQLIKLGVDGSIILQGQAHESKLTRIKSLVADLGGSVVYSLGYDDNAVVLEEWKIDDQSLSQRKQQSVFQGFAIDTDTLMLIPGPEPLLVAGPEGDGRDTLFVWSQGETSQLPGIPKAKSFLALRNETLISAHDHGPLRTWKRITSNGKTKLQPTGLIDPGIKVASLTQLNLDNQDIIVAGGVDGSLIVIRAGKLLQKIGPDQTRQSRLVSLAALPTGEVISGDDQSGIRWWSWLNPQQGLGALQPASPRVFSTGQGQIKALVAIFHQQQPSGNVLSAGADGSLRLLGQEPYALAQSLYRDQAPAASRAPISALTAWRQGAIASGYKDGSICWWGSMADSKKIPVPRCQRLPEGVSSTALVALDSEQQLIAASTDGLLRWGNNQQTLQEFGLNRGGAPSSPIQTIQPLNNSDLNKSDLVSGDAKGALQWWTSKGKPKGPPIPSGADPVKQLIVLDSNNLVSVSGLPEQLRWWNNGTPRSFSQEPSKDSRLTSISRWSGQEVITGAASGLIQRWNHGKRIGDPIATDHTSGVWAMLKLNSPPFGSAVLLTAGEGGQIGIWNSGFQTGVRGLQPNHETISTGQGKIISLLETNSGDLISGSEDGSLKITSPSRVVRAACELYKPIMAQPSSAAEREASELCSCPPPDQWWNLFQWLCFARNLIS